MILYVTTFNEVLYNHCGKAMIQSFLDKKVEGDLFIGYEGNIDFAKDFPNNKFILHNLDYDPCLTLFLFDNSDYIPVEFGGTAPPCVCKEPKIKHKTPKKERKRALQQVKERKQFKGHFKGCPHYGFNRRASLWARKIFTLKQAKDALENKYKTLFFLDADIVWKQQLTIKDVGQIMKQNKIGFMMGNRRKIAETGIVIYNHDGLALIDLLFDEYMSGRYREYDRWDDSCLTTSLMIKHKFTRVDMANKSNHASDVCQDSVLAPYLVHNKGTNSILMGSVPKRTRGIDNKRKRR